MKKSTFTPEYEILCALLRESREQAGLTQVDLAAALDETQSFVSKCERGERRLDVVQLRVFCTAIGIKFPDFIAALERRLSARKR